MAIKPAGSETTIEANTIEPVSGNQITINASTLKFDKVAERSGGNGVEVESVLLKDGEVSTDVINEFSSGAGVTVDSLLIKDGKTATAGLGNFTFATWTPSPSGDGINSLSAVTVNEARYIQIGGLVVASLSFEATLGGSASNILVATLPVNSAATFSDRSSGFGNVNMSSGSVIEAADLIARGNQTDVRILRANHSNYPTSGTIKAVLTLVYESV